MTERPGQLVSLLRSTSVQALIRALERDGFTSRRRKGAGRVYRHASDTLSIRNVPAGSHWTDEDLKRLRLIM